jgi:hypothetical protein
LLRSHNPGQSQEVFDDVSGAPGKAHPRSNAADRPAGG